MEGVEKPFLVGWRNSDPLVPDYANNFCIVKSCFEPNDTPSVRVFHRVRQQVRKNVPQQALIGLNFAWNVSQRQLDRASPTGGRQDFVNEHSQKCSQVQRRSL